MLYNRVPGTTRANVKIARVSLVNANLLRCGNDGAGIAGLYEDAAADDGGGDDGAAGLKGVQGSVVKRGSGLLGVREPGCTYEVEHADGGGGSLQRALLHQS